jgi:hypothetical protein
MGERKSLAESTESFVERQIREAMERGEFADLPGAGKPLDLDDDDPMWWIKRKMRDEGLSPVLPPRLQLRSDVATRLVAILTMKAEADVRSAVAELNGRITAFNRTSLEGSDQAPLDVDVVLDRWRKRG